jgi:signal transduction histidine kinase
MSGIRSWARRYWLELAWIAWAAANLLVTVSVVSYETVPFHFVWISLTLIYGWRLWRLRSALLAVAGVCVTTAVALGYVVVNGPQGPDELTEVPLMAVVFIAMVWHVERRQSALRAVEAAAAREREFVRAASHHLKTPIAIARALASLMRADVGRTISAEDLDNLVEELDRLGVLADDMLLLAAAEQVDSLMHDEIDFEDLIVGAARRWSRTTPRRWVVEPADGILSGDRQRLDLVLDALLENATRATKEGDRIGIAGRIEDDTAVIEISDTGVGIPAEALPHVFERFWSAPTNGSNRGTGLGLAIVQALVTAHGGTVSIASTPGLRTTVSIRLPHVRGSAQQPRMLDLVAS